MAMRRLAVEGLENRNMLAGNVLVEVSGGNLIITGDDNANGVTVQQLDNGRYAVTGFETGAGDTRINGQFNARVVSGVTGDIVVDLNGGNDSFVMGQNAFRRQALAREFTGNAALTLDASPEAANPNTTAPFQTRVPRNLLVRMDEGNDGVGISARVGSDDLRDEDFGGVAQILTHDGNDRVVVERTTAFNDLLLETGDGSDTVRGTQLRTHDFLFAALGAGDRDSISINDSIAYRSHLIGNAGADRISVNDFHTTQETFLYGEGGNDVILANGVTTGLDLQIITHDGADRVQLTNSVIDDDLYLDTGSENDVVNLSFVDVADLMHIVLGSHNDNLDINDSSSGDTLLDGSAGNDDFDNNGGNNFGSPTVINFES